MLDFSFGEIALVVLVALLVVGPKDLPVVMRTIGKWFGHLRAITDEFKNGFKSVMGEDHIADIKKGLNEINEEIQYIKDEQGNYHRVYDISDFLEEREKISLNPPLLPKIDDKRD